MEKRAVNISAGDNLCIEYGAPENFVTFKVRAVFQTDARVMVLADSKVGNETFIFRLSDKVIMMPNE